MRLKDFEGLTPEEIWDKYRFELLTSQTPVDADSILADAMRQLYGPQYMQKLVEEAGNPKVLHESHPYAPEAIGTYTGGVYDIPFEETTHTVRVNPEFTIPFVGATGNTGAGIKAHELLHAIEGKPARRKNIFDLLRDKLNPQPSPYITQVSYPVQESRRSLREQDNRQPTDVPITGKPVRVLPHFKDWKNIYIDAPALAMLTKEQIKKGKENAIVRVGEQNQQSNPYLRLQNKGYANVEALPNYPEDSTLKNILSMAEVSKPIPSKAERLANLRKQNKERILRFLKLKNGRR